MKVKNNYSYMVQPGSSKGEEHMHVAVSQLFSCVKTNYHAHSLELHQLCWSKLKVLHIVQSCTLPGLVEQEECMYGVDHILLANSHAFQPTIIPIFVRE